MPNSGGDQEKRHEVTMPTPEQLPDPWLADSEWLLSELAKAREQILRIPLRLDNTSDIEAAIDRIFALEQTLRYLLLLHREGQTAFGKKADAHHKVRKVPTGTVPHAGSEEARTVATKARGKVVRLPDAASA
jgi:hypothetical protein